MGRGVWAKSVFSLQHMLFFIDDNSILGHGVELDDAIALSCWAARAAQQHMERALDLDK